MLFLPLVLFLFFFVHYYKVVHFGISLPAHEEEVGQDTANKVPADRRVYFLPDVMLDETMFLIAFTAICVVISAFFFAAPLRSIANPQVTPLHTVAPWYSGCRACSKSPYKTIAGVILPGVFARVASSGFRISIPTSRRETAAWPSSAAWSPAPS
ncbi:MAG: hypothetical protein R2838_19440 [Caldilineaceae bacterium]